MNLKTIRSLAVTSAVLAGVVGLGASAIHAATVSSSTATRQDPMTALVATIAQKFSLNQTDVQKVFDDQRTQMNQEMGTRRAEELKTRLTQAVTDGKLTQAQAGLITAKQADMKALHDSLKDKTPEERKTAMDAKMTELKQWATDNKIPEQFAHIGPMGGPGGHGGRGGRGPGDGQGGPGGMRGFGGPQGQDNN